MSGSTDELTATQVRPPTVTITATVAQTDQAFDESVRDLLHRRLRFCAWVGLAMAAALLLVALASGGGARGKTSGVAANGLFCVAAPIGLVLLRGRPGVPRLRAIELGLFGGLSVLLGALRAAELLDLPPASSDPEYPRDKVEYATVMANLPVYFLIFFYGLLIPSTHARGVAMVVLMGTVPLLAIAVAGAAHPPIRPYLPFLLAVTAFGMTAAGAGSVFGATRIGSLQRQAFEAERRADELGQYRLRTRLGAGGMGEVWLAEHRLLKRPCAVKFIRADLAAHPTNAARFAREVQAVTGLTHPNTIRLYDYGQSDDGRFYYVMEHLDGPTLEALVKRDGPLAPGRAVHLLRQLCGALGEAHAAGLVHRDLKPGNVIVATLGGQPDVAKLLDFGLVHDLSAADGEERLTQAGVVMGTPAYMCPEQAGGAARVDARGDLYALGAVAFFVLAGRPPFVRDTVGGYIAAHLTEPAPAADAVNPAVPADLAAVVARCLAKEPAARYESARELDAALAGCRCAAEG